MRGETAGPGIAPPHRVRRVRFALEGPDEAALLALRRNIADGAESWLPEALDAAFAAFDRPDRTIRIDRVEVDLGTLPGHGLTPDRLAAAIRAALAERMAIPDTPDARRAAAAANWPERRTLAEAFRVFLETGRIPWWGPAGSLAEIEREVRGLEAPAIRELARLLASALRLDRPARRLVLQVEADVAAAIAAALPFAGEAGISTLDWDAGATAAASPRAAAIDRLAARVCRAAGHDSGSPRAGPEARSTDEPRPPARASADFRPDADDSPGFEAATEDELLVADAGLVIAYPFLPTLFEARGLLVEGRFAGDAEQARAVFLVATLAAGEAARTEPELVIPKLLCGWPLEEPLPRTPTLSAADRDEANDLMAALVAQWTALGRSSPEAVRETFLTRPGRLSDSGAAWRLDVERSGTDVLVARLPWSLSVIRLPWMARPLHVDWV
jgi:hypothetical protein